MTVTENAAVTTGERAVWRAFLRASALLRDALGRDVEAQAGLSLNEYEVLERLADTPGGAVRMAALAEDLVHSRSRLTHAVHRMEARGLVERRACEADGRGVYCALTPLGADTFAAAEPRYQAAVQSYFLDRLSEDEFAVLGRVMDRITRRLAPDSGNRAAWLAERTS
jgi:DNA-binding MarR family transcriptional regulator